MARKVVASAAGLARSAVPPPPPVRLVPLSKEALISHSAVVLLKDPHPLDKPVLSSSQEEWVLSEPPRVE